MSTPRRCVIRPAASSRIVTPHLLKLRSRLDREQRRRLLEPIESTLERFNGHRAKTAQALGIGIRTLSGKLKQYGYAPRTKNFSAS